MHDPNNDKDQKDVTKLENVSTGLGVTILAILLLAPIILLCNHYLNPPDSSEWPETIGMLESMRSRKGGQTEYVVYYDTSGVYHKTYADVSTSAISVGQTMRIKYNPSDFDEVEAFDDKPVFHKEEEVDSVVGRITGTDDINDPKYPRVFYEYMVDSASYQKTQVLTTGKQVSTEILFDAPVTVYYVKRNPHRALIRTTKDFEVYSKVDVPIINY